MAAAGTLRCPLAAAIIGAAVLGAASPSIAKLEPVNALNKVEAGRALALGGGATAVGLDPALVWVNPAAAADVRHTSIVLAGTRGWFGETTGQGAWSAMLGEGMLTLGILYYDAGGIELRDSTGSVRTLRLQKDYVGAVSYARPLSWRISAGGTVKRMQSEMFEKAASGGLAFDAGVQARLNDYFKAGLAVRNAGGPVKYLGEAVGIPTAVAAGLACGLPVGRVPEGRERDRNLLVLITDLCLSGQEGAVSVTGGAEYAWRGRLFFRAGAGLRSRESLGAFAAGLGAVVNECRFDYASRFGGEFPVPHTFSLTLTLD